MGVSDLLFQVESVLYAKYEFSYLYYSTFVFNITLPTGSPSKTPSTGLGAPSFFFGITAGYLSIDWYLYNSYAIEIPLYYVASKHGRTYLYQAGIGHNLKHSKKWIFCLTLEGNGYYSQRDITNFTKDKNSGGNTFYLGPNIWIANERLAIQSGFQFAVADHLFGKQPRNLFRAGALVGWKF